MPENSRVDRVLSVALTTAALVMAAVVVFREIVPAPVQASAGVRSTAPQYYEDWRILLPLSRQLGDSAGPVHLIEFGDLECPACRHFHSDVLPPLVKAFDGKLSVRYVHLPLRNHRFARPAALAAECAATWGRFGPFVEVVFAKQDSLGLKSWASMAREAGVADTAAFGRCVVTFRGVRLDSGAAVARRLGIAATPTIVVTGWRVPQPTFEELSRAIENIMAGRDPYPRSGG